MCGVAETRIEGTCLRVLRAGVEIGEGLDLQEACTLREQPALDVGVQALPDALTATFAKHRHAMNLPTGWEVLLKCDEPDGAPGLESVKRGQAIRVLDVLAKSLLNPEPARHAAQHALALN